MSAFDGLSGAADMPARGGHFSHDGRYVPPDEVGRGDGPLAAVRAIREQVDALAQEEDDDGVPVARLVDGAAWLADDVEDVAAGVGCRSPGAVVGR